MGRPVLLSIVGQGRSVLYAGKMAVLFASVRFYSQSRKTERHRLAGINLRSSVKALREKISEELNLPVDAVELICFGKCLKVEESLESYGIKNGMTIYVLQKQEPEPLPAPAAQGLSQTETNQLVVALRSALLNPAFRNMVNQLSKPEALESIIAATPGLADDPVAIAILQDPDLLMLLSDPTHIHRVVEMHPSLAEAATHVAAAFHEEASSQNSALPLVPSLVSYSLDALSDDDEMDADPQMNPEDEALAEDWIDDEDDSDDDPKYFESMAALVASEAGALSPGTITPAHLASALAAVASGSQDAFSASTSQPPSSPQLHAPPPTPHPFITSEMFTQAMQQALGQNIQAQLQQLRDMGITDDAVSLRALQATDGDVQAALEFIFGEAAEHDNENI